MGRKKQHSFEICLCSTGPVFPNLALKYPTKYPRKADPSFPYLYKGVTEVLGHCGWGEDLNTKLGKRNTYQAENEY